tara:strand:+ start:178 stop:402 length:225 start_codon:yes stop_codon:yes gene_type:complete
MRAMRPTKPESPRFVKKASKLSKTGLGKKTDPSIDRGIVIRKIAPLIKYNQKTLIGIKKSFFIGDSLFLLLNHS